MPGGHEMSGRFAPESPGRWMDVWAVAEGAKGGIEEGK